MAIFYCCNKKLIHHLKFVKLNGNTNCLQILKNVGLGQFPGFCIPNKAPNYASTTGPWTSLWLARTQNMCLSSMASCQSDPPMNLMTEKWVVSILILLKKVFLHCLLLPFSFNLYFGSYYVQFLALDLLYWLCKQCWLLKWFFYFSLLTWR